MKLCFFASLTQGTESVVSRVSDSTLVSLRTPPPRLDQRSCACAIVSVVSILKRQALRPFSTPSRLRDDARGPGRRSALLVAPVRLRR